MNNTFSLEQVSKIGKRDSSLTTRQYKLTLMAQFMEHEYDNPMLKQSELAKKLSYSSITLQRNRQDINMLSLYRIPSYNTNRRKQALKS